MGQLFLKIRGVTFRNSDQSTNNAASLGNDQHHKPAHQDKNK